VRDLQYKKLLQISFAKSINQKVSGKLEPTYLRPK